MSSGGWRKASQEHSCPICGKPDWCSVSDDNVWAICRRKDNGTGEHKVDTSGAEYWLYRLKEPLVESVSQEDPPEVPERAEPETLDQVYGALLDELSLSHTHRQDLQRRGLSDGEIKRRGYCSLPLRGREGLAAKLIERFGPEVCSMVPGLYEKDSASTCWSIAGATGILIPVGDIEGRVIALKARADDPGEGPKYSYLSSSKHGGPGPGSQVHVPLSEDPGRGTAARLTEGELKADVATVLTKVLTVSIPGVSSWRNALPVLKALGFGKVHLAFDADARRNRNVARALSAAFRALDEQGFEVVLETWPEALGKGIDDLLAAGHQPELKLGDEARKAVNEILAEANGLSLVLNNAFTAEELMARVFPEPKWIVPGVLPEGATILAGSPKTGKSWMALGIGVAVASGGTALGGKPVEWGSVLYLALEDNPRRLQGRLRKVLVGEKPPRNLILTERDNQTAQNATLLKIALQVSANSSHEIDRRRLRNDFVTICCECPNISIAGIVDNFGLDGEEEIMEIRNADPVSLFSCVECRDPLPDDTSVKLLRSRISTLAYLFRVEVGEPVELHKLQKLLCGVCDRELRDSLEEERRAQCLALKARQKELSTMPYSEYLKTREWRVKRTRALIRAGNKCELCESVHRLSVHHRTYVRRGHELVEDLTVLCHSCHQHHHHILPEAA